MHKLRINAQHPIPSAAQLPVSAFISLAPPCMISSVDLDHEAASGAKKSTMNPSSTIWRRNAPPSWLERRARQSRASESVGACLRR
jgi:hypothetical protein